MHVGMTGSRNGVSPRAMSRFFEFMAAHDVTWMHHGDCVGADERIARASIDLGQRIHCHPPVSTTLRAFVKERELDKMEPVDGYFARNRAIVNSSEIMLAFPATKVEQKGGTWYTINYAKKQGKLLYILHFDGTVETFNK